MSENVHMIRWDMSPGFPFRVACNFCGAPKWRPCDFKQPGSLRSLATVAGEIESPPASHLRVVEP